MWNMLAEVLFTLQLVQTPDVRKQTEWIYLGLSFLLDYNSVMIKLIQMCPPH